MPEIVKLTSYSKGAGCGCKISPDVLEKILHGQIKHLNPALLVGNETKDDAAVFDIGGGRAVISTVDFFMPIVDDAHDFGKIASANALSDVYAMGGKPLFAVAILGWPVEKLPAEIAQQVLEGARAICEEAGIPLAGGHSIDSAEPIFGLAVTGEVEIKHLKKNSSAKQGDALFLTKPIGVGMVTTAHKRGLAIDADFEEALDTMTKLNSIGCEIGRLDYVNAMTDVTGFGFLGHLIEMCEGSNVSANISYAGIPKLKNLSHYVSKMIYPDITFRNWKSYETKVQGINGESLLTLCDPQTSGGMLVAVREDFEETFRTFCKKLNYDIQRIGQLREKKEKVVYIEP
jgi:selenide,water dikinase